jgi:adenine deaminase
VALLPLLAVFGPSGIAFCTDAREPEHFAVEGQVNALVRDAVAAGIPPEDALVCATSNPAAWHGLSHLGAIAPGYQADMLLLPDLEQFLPETVLKAGVAVSEVPRAEVPDWVRQTVRLGALGPEMFRVPWTGGRARVIGLVPGQIVTESLADELTHRAGEAVADPERDLAKIAVVERHLATGRIGLGFVRGFGLERGALASTFAHDAHNVVVVGMSDAAMAYAVRRLANVGGGIVAVDGGAILAELPLPVAGLLSDAPLEEVVARSRALVEAARTLGCSLDAPFQLLSFLALSVIPSLKLTDRGLVDVDRFEVVPLELS